MAKLLIKNGRYINPKSNTDEKLDLLIQDGEIVDLKKALNKTRMIYDSFINKINDCEFAFLQTIKYEENIDIYSEPDKEKKIGKLHFSFRLKAGPPVSYDPRPIVNEFIVQFIDLKEEKTDFQYDFLHDVKDPTYEVYVAEHTILARKGNWFKLPQQPFPNPVWVYVENHKPQPLSKLNAIRVRTPGYTGIVILNKVEKDHYVATEYDPVKYQCLDYKPKPGKTVTIPIKDLYDKNLHLKVEPLYLFDCME